MPAPRVLRSAEDAYQSRVLAGPMQANGTELEDGEAGVDVVLNYYPTIWLARLTSLFVTIIVSRMVLRIMPGREMM